MPLPLRRNIGFIGKNLNLKSNQLFFDFFKVPNFAVKINKLFERLTYVTNNSEFLYIFTFSMERSFYCFQ